MTVAVAAVSSAALVLVRFADSAPAIALGFWRTLIVGLMLATWIRPVSKRTSAFPFSQAFWWEHTSGSGLRAWSEPQFSTRLFWFAWVLSGWDSPSGASSKSTACSLLDWHCFGDSRRLCDGHAGGSPLAIPSTIESPPCLEISWRCQGGSGRRLPLCRTRGSPAGGHCLLQEPCFLSPPPASFCQRRCSPNQPLAGFSTLELGGHCGPRTGCKLLGHNGFNYCLRYVRASIVSAIIFLEPLGAAILAAIFLAEIPGGEQKLWEG